jgi:hypothetical protein
LVECLFGPTLPCATRAVGFFLNSKYNEFPNTEDSATKGVRHSVCESFRG